LDSLDFGLVRDEISMRRESLNRLARRDGNVVVAETAPKA